MAKYCSVPECGRTHFAKGMCEAHYARVRAGVSLDHSLRTSDGMQKVFIKMAITSRLDECILWPYGKTNSGYASSRIDGKQQDVHRYVCKQVHGEPPLSDVRYVASHLCDRKDCINPWHLFWTTQRENIQDAADKGLRTPPTKLTDEQVVEIRRRYDTEGPTKLAKQYSVHKGTIYRIATNRRRASVNV